MNWRSVSESVDLGYRSAVLPDCKISGHDRCQAGSVLAQAYEARFPWQPAVRISRHSKYSTGY